jgi:hypothetical protein
MKGFGWNEGDRSEYLALFAFSTIAYCSPVPRQQDKFGVDFFAHLARWWARESGPGPILLNWAVPPTSGSLGVRPISSLGVRPI